MLQAVRSATGTLFREPLEWDVEDKDSALAKVNERLRALRIGAVANHLILHSP